MKCRLQKILSSRGVASRRTAEKWIADGRVTVNGTPAEIGASADPENDVICVDGIRLPCLEKRVVIALNKPRGYVTTMHDEKGRKTVAQLVSSCGYHVYPVGRNPTYSFSLRMTENLPTGCVTLQERKQRSTGSGCRGIQTPSVKGSRSR